jgi:hypothetical protein
MSTITTIVSTQAASLGRSYGKHEVFAPILGRFPETRLWYCDTE